MHQKSAPVRRSEATHFLSLPAEIRVYEIYKYILPLPRDIKVTVPWNGKLQTQSYNRAEQSQWQWTNLLLVNKELHDEVTTLVYGKMEMCLLLTTYSEPPPKVYIRNGVFKNSDDHMAAISRLRTMWERRMFTPTGFSNAMNPESHPNRQYLLMCEEQRKKRKLAQARRDQMFISWFQQEQKGANHYHGPLSNLSSAAVGTPSQLEEARRYYVIRQAGFLVGTHLATKSNLAHGFPSSNATAPPTNATNHSAAANPSPNAMAPITVPPEPPKFDMEPISTFEDTLSAMEQGCCPCLANQRRVEELEAGILLTKYARGEHNSSRELCVECTKSPAQTLQICRVPYDARWMTMFPPPDERWECPIAKRYRPLVSAVKIICDGLGQSMHRLPQSTEEAASSFHGMAIRMRFALEEVVEKIRNNGLQCDMVVDMVFAGEDRTLACDAAKRLLEPFKRCQGLPIPKFNTPVWFCKEEYRKGGAVIKVDSLNDQEFLQGWKSTVSDEGGALFPTTIKVFRLIDEFVYKLVDPSLKHVYSHGFPRQAFMMRQWISDAREAADQQDFEQLRTAWSNIAAMAFIADVDTETGFEGRSVTWKFTKGEARMQELNDLVLRIDDALGGREGGR